MVGQTVPPRSDAVQVSALLDNPEIGQLVAELEATRWTGRPGYPIRTMVGMTLAKSLYALPTWTRTVALVPEHTALRCPDVADVPSVRIPATASPPSYERSSRCWTPASTG